MTPNPRQERGVICLFPHPHSHRIFNLPILIGPYDFYYCTPTFACYRSTSFLERHPKLFSSMDFDRTGGMRRYICVLIDSDIFTGIEPLKKAYVASSNVYNTRRIREKTG